MKRQANVIEWNRRAWELACMGLGPTAIAAKLIEEKLVEKISKQSVSKALLRMEAETLEGMSKDRQSEKAQQVWRLKSLCAEALESFKTSKTEKTKKVVRSGGRDGSAGQSFEVHTETTPAGDPRFLSAALDAMAELSKVLGLHEPLEAEVTGSFELKPSQEYLRDATAREIETLIELQERIAENVKVRNDGGEPPLLVLAAPAAPEPVPDPVPVVVAQAEPVEEPTTSPAPRHVETKSESGQKPLLVYAKPPEVVAAEEYLRSMKAGYEASMIDEDTRQDWLAAHGEKLVAAQTAINEWKRRIGEPDVKEGWRFVKWHSEKLAELKNPADQGRFADDYAKKLKEAEWHEKLARQRMREESQAHEAERTRESLRDLGLPV